MLKNQICCNILICGASFKHIHQIYQSQKRIIMRKISLVLVAAAMFAVGSVSANSNTTPSSTKAKLASQIQKMLRNNTFDVADDLTADVRFLINEDGEIVLLSVETSNERLEGFVKGRLNYKKVKTDNDIAGKTYTVPVRITA